MTPRASGPAAAPICGCLRAGVDRRSLRTVTRVQVRRHPADSGPCPGQLTGATGHRSGYGRILREEDDMSDTTPALDEAYERIAAASFELPNGFVNHGAMACEALATLDCPDDIDSWARRFAQAGGVRVEPVPAAGFEWRQALGSYDRLPEWIGYFTRAIDDDGWAGVARTWVPRLMPALRTALFHGAIRTAHAVRAIDAVDTPPRRAE